MVEIKKTKIDSKDFHKFHEWINKEWNDVERAKELNNEELLPKSLLSYEGDKLVGGLSFIFFKHPENNEQVIWINALYIEPNSRGKGIASMLIKEAEKNVIDKGQYNLYVYTDKPNLYIKQHWEILNENENMYVLKKLLKVV